MAIVRRRLGLGPLCLLGLLLPGLAPTAGLGAPFAYLPNSVAHTVTALDTAINTVRTTIPVGSNPVGVAIARDGSRVYVANADSHSVSVIATATHTVLT